MRYSNITRARFADRPNRFIAHVEVDGQIETVHVEPDLLEVNHE